MRPRARALLLFFAVLFACAGCDQASKRVAISTLTDLGSVSVVGDSLRFELTSNPGAFLGLGARLPDGVRDVVFIVALPLLVVWLCVYFLRSVRASVPLLVALGLLAGGGLGNWLDRLLHHGAVTDFIILGVGPLSTGVFNIADVAVMAGVGILVLATRGADGSVSE